jgi:hypothetical protein
MRSQADGAYVDHLLAEHRRLDKLIRQTLANLPNWEEADLAAWQPRVKAGLSAIRAELAQHFREEEAGGCIEEAVSRCPALAAEARQVASEHAEILRQIDALLDRCAELLEPTAVGVSGIERQVQELVRRLRAHAARENKLIERGFAISLEHEDASEPRCAGAPPSG